MSFAAAIARSPVCTRTIKDVYILPDARSIPPALSTEDKYRHILTTLDEFTGEISWQNVLDAFRIANESFNHKFTPEIRRLAIHSLVKILVSHTNLLSSTSDEQLQNYLSKILSPLFGDEHHDHQSMLNRGIRKLTESANNSITQSSTVCLMSKLLTAMGLFIRERSQSLQALDENSFVFDLHMQFVDGVFLPVYKTLALTQCLSRFKKMPLEEARRQKVIESIRSPLVLFEQACPLLANLKHLSFADLALLLGKAQSDGGFTFEKLSNLFDLMAAPQIYPFCLQHTLAMIGLIHRSHQNHLKVINCRAEQRSQEKFVFEAWKQKLWNVNQLFTRLSLKQSGVNLSTTAWISYVLYELDRHYRELNRAQLLDVMRDIEHFEINISSGFTYMPEIPLVHWSISFLIDVLHLHRLSVVNSEDQSWDTFYIAAAAVFQINRQWRPFVSQALKAYVEAHAVEESTIRAFLSAFPKMLNVDLETGRINKEEADKHQMEFTWYLLGQLKDDQLYSDLFTTQLSLIDIEANKSKILTALSNPNVKFSIIFSCVESILQRGGISQLLVEELIDQLLTSLNMYTPVFQSELIAILQLIHCKEWVVKKEEFLAKRKDIVLKLLGKRFEIDRLLARDQVDVAREGILNRYREPLYSLQLQTLAALSVHHIHHRQNITLNWLRAFDKALKLARVYEAEVEMSKSVRDYTLRKNWRGGELQGLKLDLMTNFSSLYFEYIEDSQAYTKELQTSLQAVFVINSEKKHLLEACQKFYNTCAELRLRATILHNKCQKIQTKLQSYAKQAQGSQKKVLEDQAVQNEKILEQLRNYKIDPSEEQVLDVLCQGYDLHSKKQINAFLSDLGKQHALREYIGELGDPDSPPFIPHALQRLDRSNKTFNQKMADFYRLQASLKPLHAQICEISGQSS